MTLKECLLVNNDCYRAATPIETVTGIVVHSTGCNNKTLRRYVNPVKGQANYDAIIADIGRNLYNNHWNHTVDEMKRSVCVHAFIGVNAAGKIETYQTLPFEYCCWGVGSGINGSYNYNPYAHIQFEICEDGLTDKTYFTQAMREAQEFCVYLCNRFNIPVSSICSHAEAYKQGYGSNHGDCDFWLRKFGRNMDWFRSEVSKLQSSSSKPETLYRVMVGEYKVRSNAEQMVKRLAESGFKGHIKTI